MSQNRVFPLVSLSSQVDIAASQQTILVPTPWLVLGSLRISFFTYSFVCPLSVYLFI